MFRETDRLTDLIYERLSSREEEKKLILLAQSYSIFKKMISVELTQQEWEAISVIPAKAGIQEHGSPIKTRAALPQCCFAAFGDDVS